MNCPAVKRHPPCAGLPRHEATSTVCKVLCAVVIVLVAQACSPISDEAENGNTTQAITADWIHPDCRASELAPPSNDPQLCNGPWVYSYQEWWRDRAACGDSATCTVRNACTSWDRDASGDGLGFTTASWPEATLHQFYCPGGRRPGPCAGDFPSTACPSDATTRRSQLIATRPGISAPALGGFSISWSPTTLSVDIDPEPPAGGGTHASKTTFRCDLSINNFPSQRTDARPACSCAEYAPRECPRGGSTTVFTPPGAHVPSSPGAPSTGSSRREFFGAPQCTTCDQFAIDNPGSAQAKFTCLDGSLDHIRSLRDLPVVGPATSLDVVASIAARMELLLQLAADQLTADIADTGLSDDIAVLAALFADEQDGTSPVLLTLTGDSLRALEDRLVHLEAIHDVGCRFAACKTSSSLRSSAVSELVHALSALPDPAKLGPVLASASKLQQQQPALHAALGQLEAHHARLATAWSALGRSEPFGDLAKVGDPPAEVAVLAKIVREATLAWSSYERTGELDPGHRPRLTAATLEQGAVVGTLDSLIVLCCSTKEVANEGSDDGSARDGTRLAAGVHR